MKYSIGIDVSLEKLDIAIYDGEKYIFQKTFTYNENGISKIISLAKKYSGHVTMEVTGNYHLKLAKSIYDAELPVSVVNSLIIKRFSQMKNIRVKTDRVDARLIAKYGYEQKPCNYRPAGKIEESIRVKTEAIENLIKTKVEYSNRLHALENDIYPNDDVKNLYMGMIEKCINEIARLEREIIKMIKLVYAHEYEKVKQIPGVGNRGLAIIFGHLGCLKYFENAKQLSSYIGINPCPYQSGSSILGKGSISKKGNGYVRSIFFMMALSAKNHNLQCREMYERMKAKGKAPKVILIAIANKLLRQIFAVIKNKRDYCENYHIILREKYNKRFDF